MCPLQLQLVCLRFSCVLVVLARISQGLMFWRRRTDRCDLFRFLGFLQVRLQYNGLWVVAHSSFCSAKIHKHQAFTLNIRFVSQIWEDVNNLLTVPSSLSSHAAFSIIWHDKGTVSYCDFLNDISISHLHPHCAEKPVELQAACLGTEIILKKSKGIKWQRAGTQHLL